MISVITTLPEPGNGTLEQAVVTNAQLALQLRLPLTNPRPWQVCPPSAVPSHASVPSIRLSPQVVQLSVSYVQLPAQLIVPPSKPSPIHVPPPSKLPSQSSPGSSVALPHEKKSHPDSSKLQFEAQANVPVSKPSRTQVSPPRAEPSQSSPVSMASSPQVEQALVSKSHSVLHKSVPDAKPCEAHVSPPRSLLSHSSMPSIRPLPHSVSVSHCCVSSVHSGLQSITPPGNPAV